MPIKINYRPTQYYAKYYVKKSTNTYSQYLFMTRLLGLYSFYDKVIRSVFFHNKVIWPIFGFWQDYKANISFMTRLSGLLWHILTDNIDIELDKYICTSPYYLLKNRSNNFTLILLALYHYLLIDITCTVHNMARIYQRLMYRYIIYL